MDYSEMSDGEINKLVAIRLGVKPRKTICFISYKDGEEIWPEYCNNPADAWPIIAENRISIFFDETNPEYEGTPYRWCNAISSCQTHQVQYLSNPLRAAMIVFLMMQESK